MASEEATAAICQYATDAFDYWKANASETQRAQGAAELNRYMTEPEYAQAETAKALAAFTAAGEGSERLNTAQYTTFQETMVASEKAKGQFVDERNESFIAEYNALNAINPAADGISQEEWTFGMGHMMGKFMQLKAAAGL